MRAAKAFVTLMTAAGITVWAGSGAAAQEAQNRGGSQLVSADDYAAIQQLYAEYCYHWDLATDDGSAVASVFAEDGMLKFGTTEVKGRSALAEYYVKNERPTPRNRHVMTNFWITRVDSTTGRVHARMLAHPDGTPVTIQRHSVLDDLVVKTADGWKIKRRSPLVLPSR